MYSGPALELSLVEEVWPWQPGYVPGQPTYSAGQQQLVVTIHAPDLAAGQERAPADIVVVLDVSGSMGEPVRGCTCLCRHSH